MVLLSSKAHNADKERGQSIKTAEVMDEWFDYMLEKNPNGVVVMDSYYLSKAGRKSANDKKINIIAAVNPTRMKKLHQYVSLRVREVGQFCAAFNTTTNEAVVFHWSHDTHIGKKMVFSNCFELK